VNTSTIRLSVRSQVWHQGVRTFRVHKVQPTRRRERDRGIGCDNDQKKQFSPITRTGRGTRLPPRARTALRVGPRETQRKERFKQHDRPARPPPGRAHAKPREARVAMHLSTGLGQRIA
jgi:hypothetical protein